MSKIKLFIGIPINSSVHPLFMQCLLALQTEKPCDLEIHVAHGDGVARARNQLSAKFLKTDCTHLLFLDCDLMFGADHISRLLSHNEDIVGGFYPKKQDGDLEWVINGTLEPSVPDARGLHPVRYIGTGFMLIARRVFERMIEAYPDIMYFQDGPDRPQQWDFWPMGVYVSKDGNRRYLSEDWYFCQRWLDIGGQVFGDIHVIVKHIGTVVFPLLHQIEQIQNPRRQQAEDSTDSVASVHPSTNFRGSLVEAPAFG